MKKLFNVLVLTLAVNFLALGGVVGWMVQTKKLDRDKVQAIKELLFPKPAPEAPTSQPSDDGAETPTTSYPAASNACSCGPSRSSRLMSVVVTCATSGFTS